MQCIAGSCSGWSSPQDDRSTQSLQPGVQGATKGGPRGEGVTPPGQAPQGRSCPLFSLSTSSSWNLGTLGSLLCPQVAHQFHVQFNLTCVLVSAVNLDYCFITLSNMCHGHFCLCSLGLTDGTPSSNNKPDIIIKGSSLRTPQGGTEGLQTY